MEIINSIPAFEHDCDNCRFAGRIHWDPALSCQNGFTVGREPSTEVDDAFGSAPPNAADLYTCFNHHGHSNKGRGAVIRYGDELTQAISTFEISRFTQISPELDEAFTLAFKENDRII